MFDSLNSKLESVFKKLKGRGLLNEADVDAALKEIRVALLEADVHFKVVKDFTGRIRERAVGAEVFESMTPGQQVVKIVLNELTILLGGEQAKIHLAPNPPTIIMMVGLQGSGKTTTAAKLASIYKKEGRRPMMVAADLQRPAAIDQLVTLGGQIGVPVFHTREHKDPPRLCMDSLDEAKKQGRDILILDTAGRLHIDEDLMAQLKRIKTGLSPKETLFVADSMTGQDAVNIAKGFDEGIGIDGVILTKMDGDARGGAALSIKAITGKPIKYIGIGEKIGMLEPFHPDRAARRILGMGDVLTLIDKAQSAFDQNEALSLQTKLMSDSFTFEDMKDQVKKLKSMGPIENILSMIPGMGKQLKGVKVDEKGFGRLVAVIDSMTPGERKNASIINGSRRKRIARGSGTTVTDVNRVIKQYLEMKKIFKSMKSGRMPKFKMPF